MTANNPDTPHIWNDPDDAPELDEAFFDRADLMQGDQVIRRGGRPKSPRPKAAVNLRLDTDVLDHFRATGKGWQTRLNALLRREAGL